MAICTYLSAGQVMADLNTPPAQCLGYVLLDVTEYTGFPTVADLFVIPDIATAGTLWMAGFATPMIAYLVAYSVGRLIKMWDD